MEVMEKTDNKRIFFNVVVIRFLRNDEKTVNFPIYLERV